MSTHKARKRFGQNFLNNDQIIHQIIQTISVRKEQYIVEIGPGKGALTQYLIKQAKHLTAIELDRDLLPLLNIQFATFQDKFNLINKDALEVDFSSLQIEEKVKIRLVGNLPYNISTPLLFHLQQYHQHIDDMHFMLQNEVVDRLVAYPNTKAYGRLSLMMQYYFQIEKKFIVPPHAFDPMPKVDSAIVSLRPHQNLEQVHGLIANKFENFETICKSAFQQRRKTIRNNLKGMIGDEGFIQLGIDPGLRAENLTLKQFIELSNLYSL